MNPHDATEQAYKNGYERGIRDFVELLKDLYSDSTIDYDKVADMLLRNWNVKKYFKISKNK